MKLWSLLLRDAGSPDELDLAKLVSRPVLGDELVEHGDGVDFFVGEAGTGDAGETVVAQRLTVANRAAEAPAMPDADGQTAY